MANILNSGRKRLHLSKDVTYWIKYNHPWLLDVFHPHTDFPPAGTIADAYWDYEYIATGFVDPSSDIKMRLLSRKPVDDINVHLKSLISNSCSRRSHLRSSTNAIRLIHGENDFIPGLVLDWYNGHGVVQMDGEGAKSFYTERIDLVKDIVQDSGFALESLSTTKSRDILFGENRPDMVEINENGTKMMVDLARGQKTGMFIDQRDNRQLVANLANGKDVLNLFSYSGGFSLNCHLKGASHVTSVDISGRALELAKTNYELNNLDQSKGSFVESNVWNYLRETDDTFDLIICDPISYARRESQKKDALRTYRKLNNLALTRLRPNGILVACSCSTHIPMVDFMAALTDVTVMSGRQMQTLFQTGAASDHPVRLGFPEGYYLKCVALACD